MPEYIEMEPPTWEYAMRIYTTVLMNPEAGKGAHESAIADLMKLAQTVDRCRLVPKERSQS
jgi:hypothetical protein